jgi:FlaA1/EpsC-like NDP-sugar epimerase
MSKELQDKSVLVIGGTGSVGTALTMKILESNPHVVRVFSNDEDGLSRVSQILAQHENVRFLVGDIRDPQRLRLAMEDIDVVFHLASLKHVPICEYNPFEAVKTNILGTQNIIEASMAADAERVIFTSSDKAANPANVLGATKLTAEKLITAANYYRGPHKCAFSSVRLGNVLGSRGSIFEIVMNQLKSGEKSVKVTEPSMTRFIMPMDRAVSLILRAFEVMTGGETFVFKMNSVQVIDLLRAMVKLGALKMGYDMKDINIHVVGARPGDKFHEELITVDEAQRTLELDDLFIVCPTVPELYEKVRAHYLSLNAQAVQLKSYSSRDIRPLSAPEVEQLVIESLGGE